MNIGICIINYNSYGETIDCLKSLFEQTFNNYQILLLDNASINNSVDKIIEFLSNGRINYVVVDEENQHINDDKCQLYFLRSKLNGGFSSGNNKLFLFVKEYLPNTTHLLFLNNDTVISPDFLEHFALDFSQLTEKYHTPIALGSREVNYFTKKNTHSGFQYLHLLSGLSFPKPVLPCFKYVCGACLMVDIHAPLMDDGYFLYYDDVEYCKILRQSGYQLCVSDNSFYYHKLSATTSKISNTTKYQFISMWRFFKRNYPFLLHIVFVARYFQHVISNKIEKNTLLKCTFKQR